MFDEYFRERLLEAEQEREHPRTPEEVLASYDDAADDDILCDAGDPVRVAARDRLRAGRHVLQAPRAGDLRRRKPKEADGTSEEDPGPRAGARPRRRRHRPDHPEAVPEADRAHRASASSCSTTGARRVSSSTRRGRSSSPAATSAAAPRASTRCGRSQDFGFKAVVAPSFADIFYGNCTKTGLLPVRAAGGGGPRADGGGARRPSTSSARSSRFDGREVALRDQPRDARAAAERPRRHRAHARARRTTSTASSEERVPAGRPRTARLTPMQQPPPPHNHSARRAAHRADAPRRPSRRAPVAVERELRARPRAGGEDRPRPLLDAASAPPPPWRRRSWGHRPVRRARRTGQGGQQQRRRQRRPSSPR